MGRNAWYILMVSLVICLFVTFVSAGEPLHHGYYVSGGHDCPQVPRISAPETKKLFDEGKVILINPMEKDKSLLGSINIQADKLKNDAMILPRNVLVVFYCS